MLTCATSSPYFQAGFSQSFSVFHKHMGGLVKKGRIGVLQRPLCTAIVRSASGPVFVYAVGNKSQLDPVE